ncbi:hypothetical protein DTO027B5_4722 [Paecilomyces variotii]|nr:hypothetical protein DTO027B3_2136 [Paecilomyces variotii]KAJ9333538.1 hypothetical protein DTO027B5_4722 [Paecilomyces variotii]
MSSISQPTGRLISHFANRSRETQSTGWSELWETNQSDLWDRGKPSPALIDFIESRPAVLPKPENGRRLRALVPGCGRGYDVVALTLHGFDTYGLEVSNKAVETAREYAKSELAKPIEHNYGEKSSEWPLDHAGKAEFVQGDFFQRDWEAACASDGVRGFDLIYDYTFLCALLPEMRKDWARRMRELLAPGGILVCLEFPLHKDLKAQGPPWGLRGVYWDLLAVGNDGILNEPSEETDGAQGPFERVLYFKPARSYDSGRGTDMVSVWRARAQQI